MRPGSTENAGEPTAQLPGTDKRSAEVQPISAAEALKRSAIVQELPLGPGVIAPNPTLVIETHISHEVHPMPTTAPELVGAAQVPLNSARIEQASQVTVPAPAPPTPLSPPGGDGRPAPSIVQSTPVPPATFHVHPPAMPALEPQEPGMIKLPLAETAPVNDAIKTRPQVTAMPISREELAAPMAPPAPVPTPPADGIRTLINSTQMTLNYRVGRVGPSGLGKVEVWATPDQGNTWQRLCEDLDRRSPSDIQLPGEGVWGLRLVASNGNGFGGAAPKRGEAPAFHVEVDTTAPRVQLNSVEPAEGQTLDIRWTAQDSNLGAAPVTILYRTQPNQPWQVIAAKLQNTGSFRWQFPREHAHFYVRVQVSDEAGNVLAADSPTPVAVDVTVPQLVVVGVGVSVSGASKR